MTFKNFFDGLAGWLGVPWDVEQELARVKSRGESLRLVREGRNPKVEGRPKSESKRHNGFRSPGIVMGRSSTNLQCLAARLRNSDFGLGISNFFRTSDFGFRTSLLLLALLLASVPSCCTVPSFPAINLSEPGWTVRRGQAVWKRGHDAPEIAGDILLATRADGRTFVQFTKDPFPLIVAQSTPEAWEVKVPMQNEEHAGHGKPPKRLIWLYLPRVLSGAPPPSGWIWHEDTSGWSLKNPKTGESLEGYFAQ